VKHFVLIVSVLVAGNVFAQEIGTEITPSTPNSGVQPQPQNNPPPANNDPPKSGYVYKPKGSENASSGTPGTPAFTGTKVSASSGDFGIRAGFGASGTPSLATGAGTTVAAPSVGIAYFAGDAFKLLVDLGFGMILNSSTPFALNATLGFDYMFRTPADAMRPFFHAAASFLMAGGSSNLNVGFGAQLGFGAEYFFAPAFAVNARLLLAVPMSVANGFVLGLFTVTPGVGATWYL
jgi:hypothetical protein